ncbi:MAG: hypothetical protein J6Y92_09705 [Lentisphaeria bacterium]|nr:hypothetical protein [Lentisphaeria bacterium]
MKNRNELFIVLVVIGIVVIAVIAAISGMLQPALNQAHAKQCVSNLSQIGKGFFQYSMSYDSWYPTVRKYKTKRISESLAFGGVYEHDIPVDGGKWLDADSYKAFTLLRDEDLLTNPKVFLCPGKSKISPAQLYGSLQGHVAYNWCDGLAPVGEDYISLVSADGADNHGNTGFFVRGDGSVGPAKGTLSVKWYQTDSVKNSCKSPTDLPSYSF